LFPTERAIDLLTTLEKKWKRNGKEMEKKWKRNGKEKELRCHFQTADEADRLN